jgi:hypothetical protein
MRAHTSFDFKNFQTQGLRGQKQEGLKIKQEVPIYRQQWRTEWAGVWGDSNPLLKFRRPK